MTLFWLALIFPGFIVGLYVIGYAMEAINKLTKVK